MTLPKTPARGFFSPLMEGPERDDKGFTRGRVSFRQVKFLPPPTRAGGAPGKTRRIEDSVCVGSNPTQLT